MPSIRDLIKGKAPFKKRDKRAMVCIDYANWAPFLSQIRVKIEWAEFHKLLTCMYSEVSCRFYDGTMTKDYYFENYSSATDAGFKKTLDDRDKFHKKLKAMGYGVVTKPISGIRKRSGSIFFKCNFDVEITADALENLNSYDVFVLCSGDGDFVYLLKKLKAHQKETHLIAVEGRVNKKLQQTANHHDHLQKLLAWDKDLKQKKP